MPLGGVGGLRVGQLRHDHIVPELVTDEWRVATAALIHQRKSHLTQKGEYLSLRERRREREEEREERGRERRERKREKKRERNREL